MKVQLLGLVFGMMISLSGFSASGGGFIFTVDSVSGDPGTQVSVAIRAMNFDSIISIQGTVGFDTSKLDFAGVANYSLPSMGPSNFGTTNVQNGQLTFSWNESNLTPISIPDSSILFEAVFLIIGQPGTDAFVQIQNVPTIIEVADWTFSPIPFTTEAGNVHINMLPGGAIEPVLLFADSVSGYTNSSVFLSLKTSNFDSILAMDGSLQWDPTVADFQYLSGFTALGMSGISNFGISQVNQGKLIFYWSDLSFQGRSLPDSTTLFIIEFKLIGQAGSNCDLAIVDQPLAIQFMRTGVGVVADSVIFGHISVLDTLVGIEKSFENKPLQIYPNPIGVNSQTFYLNIEMEGEKVEEIELLDLHGKVLEKAMNWEQQGTQITGQVAKSVPAGIWLVKISTTKQVHYSRIIIDRH